MFQSGCQMWVIVKTSGLLWRPCSDDISVEIRKPKESEFLTRRTICSQIERLFDPRGIIAPVIVWANIPLQQLWISTRDWDEPVYKKIESTWKIFEEQLSYMQCIRDPRFVLLSGQCKLQLQTSRMRRKKIMVHALMLDRWMIAVV